MTVFMPLVLGLGNGRWAGIELQALWDIHVYHTTREFMLGWRRLRYTRLMQFGWKRPAVYKKYNDAFILTA